MTKLFETNSYLTEFKSKVINVNKEEKKIELEETAFYGKSGGQPGDLGKLIYENIEIEVLETIKQDGKIINLVNEVNDLTIGSEVEGKIDWNIRYQHMKMHTALHLMCSIIPLGVTGGQIGYNKSRLDFNDPNKEINKEELEKKINLLVEENHEVTSKVIDSKILDEKPELVRTMSVKPPQTNDKIRLIKIGSVDIQPCGGTHVKSTKEIGKIKIGKIENKGKMNRRVNLILSG